MLLIALYILLAFFVVAQLRVLVLIALLQIYRQAKGLRGGVSVPLSAYDGWPTVVVQLPVYREHKVIDRLLSSVLQMNYAPGKLAIQVLDDSEDEEAGLTEAVVRKHQTPAIPITYCRRAHRHGYKSGALNNGSRQIESDLVAIFDADFMPHPNFLLRTVPLFADSRVAAVHTRWRHLHESISPLALLQASILDSLFCFENGLRQSMGKPSIYLGTSGVWRKQVVEELGGWREAPFTDDGIDLSFRAQIAGWKVVYVDEPLAAAELPDSYLTYKNQQRRWACAVMRLARDYARYTFARPNSSGTRFLELSALHLVLSTPVLVFVALLTGLFVALGLPRSPQWLAVQIGLTAFLIFLPVAQEGLISQRLLYEDWQRRCLIMLLALPLGIGVSLSILAGFLDSMRTPQAEFVTTPKQGVAPVIQNSRQRWLRTSAGIAASESALAILIGAALVLAVLGGYSESWLLLGTLCVAFVITAAISWREIRQRWIELV